MHKNSLTLKSHLLSVLNRAEANEVVSKLFQQLTITDEQTNKLKEIILQEINLGLAKDTHNNASVKCYPTYVQDLPNGKERGKFIALDLGGTNFRVLLINVTGKHEYQTESRIYAIPEHIMIGSGVQLFDHVAECLANFMFEYKIDKERLPLGFTFSFPLKQVGLKKGILMTWTKGFNCDGVVNRDVVQLLKDAIDRREDIQIDICAILNDTTGTLMSCAWQNPNCKIGLIIGTGTNACYLEKAENVQLLDNNVNSKPYMIINTEWGALGENGSFNFIRTEFDDYVDRHSMHPGRYIFEKMSSGMYMGELVRLVLLKLIQAGVLFKGKHADILSSKSKFFTKYVSEIESDNIGTYTNCRMILEELGIKSPTDDDCALVRFVCECISTRAAHLISCGLATLINKMDEPNVTIGVDGSVYRFHPNFHDLMVNKISSMIKPNIKFELMLSTDGSGRGAALVAAVACCSGN